MRGPVVWFVSHWQVLLVANTGDDRFAAFDAITYFNGNVDVGRHQQVCAGAKLYQAELLPLPQCITNRRPANDPACQYTGDLRASHSQPVTLDDECIAFVDETRLVTRGRHLAPFLV